MKVPWEIGEFDDITDIQPTSSLYCKTKVIPQVDSISGYGLVLDGRAIREASQETPF